MTDGFFGKGMACYKIDTLYLSKTNIPDHVQSKSQKLVFFLSSMVECGILTPGHFIKICNELTYCFHGK